MHLPKIWFDLVTSWSCGKLVSWELISWQVDLVAIDLVRIDLVKGRQMEDGLAAWGSRVQQTVLHLILQRPSNIPTFGSCSKKSGYSMFGPEISVPSLCNFPQKYVSLLEICTPSGNLYPQNIYSCKKFVQQNELSPVVRILLSFDTNIAPWGSKYPYTVGSRLFHLQ